MTRRLLLSCVALLLALTGCAAAPTQVPLDGSGLAFSGTTVDGAPFDAGELAGTPVVLWFWAPF